MTTLYRINPNPYLETRTKGRTIRGISVPFDTPTRIVSPVEGEFWEVFNNGAFARTIKAHPDGFPFNVLHDRKSRLPIGVSTVTREDAGGLYQEFKIPETVAGDEVLELAREGVPLGLSIGFRPQPNGDKWNDDRSWVWRTEVELRETSIVNEAAYADAKVLGVRGNIEMDHGDTGSDDHGDDAPSDDPTEAPSDDPTADDDAGAGSDPNSYESRLAEVAGFMARVERYT